MKYGKKSLLLGLQGVLLMFGTLIVYSLVDSRESRNDWVTSSISREWGGEMRFKGVLAVDTMMGITSVSPEEFNCNVEINSQTLHRNIYETQVYDAEVNTSGTFVKSQIDRKLGNNFLLCLDVSGHRIDKIGNVTVCGKPYRWKVEDGNLLVALNADSLPDVIDFSTSFKVRGSKSFFVAQAGNHNIIRFNGRAPNPSFTGETLPLERSVGHDTFDATWEGSGRPSASGHNGYYNPYVGADFLVGVSGYQKVGRSLKYSFVVILLTYISVLVVEILRRRQIPLFNYFLIGVALVLYYTLLLSFVELMAFGLAYLIASLMTVGLIAGYMGMITHSRKVGVAIGILLALYYAACYVMLGSTYALLIGSLLLFAAIALLMCATLMAGNKRIETS